jgi:hypothetical protein
MANQNQESKKTQTMSEPDATSGAQKVADRVSEITDRVQSGVAEVNRQVRDKLEKTGFSEATIPDAFRGAPKIISPGVHRWLDVAVTAYYGVLGAIFASRGKGGAAAAAFINGGMVAGMSMMTDYYGTGEKPISFKLHGTLDAVQAGIAALGPVIHGFADEPESAFFYGQAGNEVLVIATTDWDAGMRSSRRRRKAA